jgi:hypothetical protein
MVHEYAPVWEVIPATTTLIGAKAAAEVPPIKVMVTVPVVVPGVHRMGIVSPTLYGSPAAGLVMTSNPAV